ncbi:unnamed protein product [Protopolystoma xenopodis]|uniref:Uncharacterized protein n=1 Tax=Protopolystoma xenopodis TaxID=117903 RepID=A0A448WKS3_9PLAT|nr:unnamed protein product [Protopolystoma xenopodis]
MSCGVVLRLARLKDDADNDSGESVIYHAYYGLRTRTKWKKQMLSNLKQQRRDSKTATTLSCPSNQFGIVDSCSDPSPINMAETSFLGASEVCLKSNSEAGFTSDWLLRTSLVNFPSNEIWSGGPFNPLPFLQTQLPSTPSPSHQLHSPVLPLPSLPSPTQLTPQLSPPPPSTSLTLRSRSPPTAAKSVQSAAATPPKPPTSSSPPSTYSALSAFKQKQQESRCPSSSYLDPQSHAFPPSFLLPPTGQVSRPVPFLSLMQPGFSARTSSLGSVDATNSIARLLFTLPNTNMSTSPTYSSPISNIILPAASQLAPEIFIQAAAAVATAAAAAAVASVDGVSEALENPVSIANSPASLNFTGFSDLSDGEHYSRGRTDNLLGTRIDEEAVLVAAREECCLESESRNDGTGIQRNLMKNAMGLTKLSQGCML